MTDPIESARRSYAEELCRLNGISSPAILAAFATVPRERFVGPGPWVIQSSGTSRFTEDADPTHVYRDALIVLDEAKRLNNGQPSLWAIHLDLLRIQPRRSHSPSRLRHGLLHRDPRRAHRPGRQSHCHRNRGRPRSPCAHRTRALAAGHRDPCRRLARPLRSRRCDCRQRRRHASSARMARRCQTFRQTPLSAHLHARARNHGAPHPRQRRPLRGHARGLGFLCRFCRSARSRRQQRTCPGAAPR